MNPVPLSQAKDDDARNVTAALLRAALRAREIAKNTQTDLIVVRNGEVVRVHPDDLRG